MQRDAFFLRRYDPDLVAFVSGRLRPSGVFLDVGAHVGLITFSVAARVPGIEVHAFEASGANAARWRRNHELNPGAAAVLVEAAVGAASGEVDFAAPPTGESGWGSISGPTDGRLSMRVPVVTLDDYAVDRGLEFVDVVKVDIEGYEPFAVQGASRLLSERRVGCLVLEVNEPVLRRVGSSGGALQRSLEELGYQAFPVPRTGARRFRREKPTNVAFVAG